MQIRRLLPADVALYREIRLEALQLVPEAYGSTFAAESTEPLSSLAARLENSAVFAAFSGNDLVGMAGFFPRRGPKDAHKGGLWGMYVRAEARGRGIGQRLVEAVIDHARQRVEVLQLTVISGNEPARRLYTKLGFVEYGLEKRALKYGGCYWDEVLMAKPLSSIEMSRP